MNLILVFGLLIVVLPLLNIINFSLLESLAIGHKIKVILTAINPAILLPLILVLITYPMSGRTFQFGLITSLVAIVSTIIRPSRFLFEISQTEEKISFYYRTQILQKRTVTFSIKEDYEIHLNHGKSTLQKPTTLTFTSKNKVLDFYLLDKKIIEQANRL